jgi:hypothetical protein
MLLLKSGTDAWQLLFTLAVTADAQVVIEGPLLTATGPEAILTHFPVAVAVAVITSFADKALTVADQAPEFTVAVPICVAPLNTFIVVPFDSVLEPLTVVAPAHIGEVILGAALVAVVVKLEGFVGTCPRVVEQDAVAIFPLPSSGRALLAEAGADMSAVKVTTSLFAKAVVPLRHTVLEFVKLPLQALPVGPVTLVTFEIEYPLGTTTVINLFGVEPVVSLIVNVTFVTEPAQKFVLSATIVQFVASVNIHSA